jgi:hypothetical protein
MKLRPLVAAFLILTAASAFTAPPTSEWVRTDSDGQLVYKTTPGGDRIMDFSYAGYRGGGVPLPKIPEVISVSPSGADDSEAIQAALDTVAKRELKDGVRGAVLLAPGVFSCERSLTLAASGVVLRGSGSGENGTTIRLTGRAHAAIVFTGGTASKSTDRGVAITDKRVPAGAMSFHVANASSFHVGDSITIQRSITPAWLKFMGMDTLVRNGKPQTWLNGAIQTERTLTAIDGNRLTVDVPLSDYLDTSIHGTAALVTQTGPDVRISEVGAEHLRIVSLPQSAAITVPQHRAVLMNAVADGWLRDLVIENTVDSISIGATSRRVTVADVHITHATITDGAAKPSDFAVTGGQVLFLRCSAVGDNVFYFSTGARVSGPNVLLDCEFTGGGWIQPHARWATGLLVDNCRVPGGGIEFINRGEMGSGHGWTAGWAVAWNCEAKSFTIQNPPGVYNWAIGCRGKRTTRGMPFNHQPDLPEGVFDSHNTPVAPASLYRAQLRARLGEAALAAVAGK